MEKKYLTTDEVAAKFQVTSKTIQNWVRDKGFPQIKVGSVVRFDEELIQEWARKQIKTN